MEPNEFSVRWDGSVYAEETGTYEFIVKSENGVRLAVNDTKNLLIDAWVSSGPNVRDEKKSIFLLGGRAYPLSLEFFKFKEKTASIRLLWKPPHGVIETIPQEDLSPERLRETMVVKTTFPRTIGASATSAARACQRRGIKPPPRRRWTWWSTWMHTSTS